MLRRLTVALAFVALIAAGLRPPVAHAHPQMIAMSVGRNGFENIVDYTIQVEAGHKVTLTFTYADGDLADDNAHDIRLKGPGTEGLPTVRVSKDNPTASITFTPTQTGTLRIVCIVPCIGMENLAGGQIKVAKPKATGAATSLTLDLKPRDDGSVLARAQLLDARGSPMADAPVIFML
ncbi:MAG: cupredoxin domain-containing protein, partial [Chloroflexi bacterium]|nr:cupredoxin domain-containing protein [Chloroflexota bacterium]